MDVFVGIDAGGTNTKIAFVNGDGKFCSYLIDETANIADTENKLSSHAKSYGYTIIGIAITGVASYKLKKQICGIAPFKSHEFTAIGLGGLTVSGLKEAIVVSMGTGTAFIHAREKDYRHIIGTGVGGGTLQGLCQAMTGTKEFGVIEDLAKNGDLSKVDLTIGEMTQDTLPSLDPRLTASNFASITNDTQKSDLARGAINLVLEVVGTISIMAAMKAGTKDIVLTGTVTEASQAEEKYTHWSHSYGYNFIIPENAVVSTAIGAVRDYMDKY